MLIVVGIASFTINRGIGSVVIFMYFAFCSSKRSPSFLYFSIL